MRQTFLSLNVHIVFSTKNREPRLQTEWLPSLHEYLGGTLRGLGAVPLKVGGIEDHVHLLVGFKATHRVAELVQETKKASHKWLKEQYTQVFWQEGYCAMTVGPKGLPKVSEYIANQKEHHQRKSLDEEWREILILCGHDPDALENS